MSSSMSFLDLPHNVKLKIYSYSGLTRPCPIELMSLMGTIPRFTVARWKKECPYVTRKHGDDRRRVMGHNYPDCLCPRLPTQLLFVSCGFYKDSFPVLYSKKKFILRAQSANDLGLILRLNKYAPSMINSLLVRLNSWPCVRGHEDTTRDGS